jgi:hypothetical protein
MYIHINKLVADHRRVSLSRTLAVSCCLSVSLSLSSSLALCVYTYFHTDIHIHVHTDRFGEQELRIQQLAFLRKESVGLEDVFNPMQVRFSSHPRYWLRMFVCVCVCAGVEMCVWDIKLSFG